MRDMENQYCGNYDQEEMMKHADRQTKNKLTTYIYWLLIMPLYSSFLSHTNRDQKPC